MKDSSSPILPKVSIVIPTKNRYPLLYEAVESVCKQTYSNWEALIVDDGSTDGTIEQMLALSEEEPRIRFIRRSGNQPGAPACRNEGVAVSTGDYIIFLDSDDCLAPFCLKNRVEAMETHPTLDFGVFPCQLFQITPGDVALLWNAQTQENDIDRLLNIYDIPWQTTSPIWRRQALTHLGVWDESLLRWQDWDFHFRALVKGLNYKRFSEPDCFWRMRTPGRDSIGAMEFTPEHIRSNERLFLKVYSMLSQEQMLDGHRRYLLARLYFWLANKWLACGAKKEAAKVWAVCREKKLIGNIEYQEGLFYFRVEDVRFAERLARKYLEKRWRRNLNVGYSTTFQKTLLSHDKSTIIPVYNNGSK
jgi:glycosyltransferase involved in cell wall biosynthesis